ncbi:HDOD domain-containing protein [Azomonas macrocytogenes]|uniref:HD-like signal output (HDOD) protein/ActR/RegA family two-component response regulator n=1 Tax=Azomonas macrocytogenes TaxID=69962 RepID=A0A839T608_AZOMA|nr:HD-like signal output (HDOD) protein/ActR/RegA family two-component response regulator [Azomonas macrocytogenes]
MPPSASAPLIIIADNDPEIADLLARIVAEVRPDARAIAMDDGRKVLTACKRQTPDLLIADVAIATLDGLSLLRELRGHGPTQRLPCILLDGKASAANVRAAQPLHPAAYLSKPLDRDDLRKRLGKLLATDTPVPPRQQQERLDDFLEQLREAPGKAPILEEIRSATAQCLQAGEYDLHDLEKIYKQNPHITAYLIHAANSAVYYTATPCTTLPQALARLGIKRTLNLILSATLEEHARLADHRLADKARGFTQQAIQVAQTSAWLAKQLKLDAELCYTAGLLHNLGELVLLHYLQKWQDQGGELDEAQRNDIIERRGASFGSALRAHWRLPINLRQLIGAYYSFWNGVVVPEALVLNLAGQLLRLPEGQEPGTLFDVREARMLRLDRKLLAEVPRQSASSAH